MINTVSLEELDRTLFEIIRKRIVELGYLPDINDFTKPQDYKRAKQVIIDSKGFCIDLHGVGTPAARGEVLVCDITIDRMDIEAGTLGGSPSTQYRKKVDGFYQKERTVAMSSNVDYEIRVVTNAVATERIILGMMYDLFNHRAYYPVADMYRTEDDDRFLLFMSGGEQDVSSTDVRERLLKYTVSDVWLGSNKIILDNIPPMTSVDPFIGLS